MIAGKIAKLNQMTQIVTVGFGLSWFELIGEAIKFGRKLFRGHANEGMYEVLEYETSLILHDPKGKRATVRKREKVRYLQDNIIAFQDEAFGDGEILIAYKCSPGAAVDKYRLGHKTKILISLHAEKRKGEEDEFLITWNWKDGFLVDTGFWDTHINHKTHKVKVHIRFPKSRPPQRVFLVEQNAKKRNLLVSSSKSKLPNGDWNVSWGISNPRLFENYLLVWEW